MRENPVFLKHRANRRGTSCEGRNNRFSSLLFLSLNLLLPIRISTLPAPGLVILQRLQCVNCSNTLLHQDSWWQWPSDQWPAALRAALLQQPVSQWGCSSKSTYGRRLCSNMCFGNTDLPRVHSSQCHPHSRRHFCDRWVTASVHTGQQK